MNRYSLPFSVTFGGKEYAFDPDFRRVLRVLGVLSDENCHEAVRWLKAMALFYREDIPPEHHREAMEYLGEFLTCGEKSRPGPRLMDWEHDAAAILSDVNRAAGKDVRGEGFVHWWTFLSWFHGIGEGQLSLRVSIRDKLRRGRKLSDWEREYYHAHKAQLDLPKRLTAEEQAEKERLKKMLE